MSASTPSLRCVRLVDAPLAAARRRGVARASKRDAAPALAPHALMQRAGDAVARLALALAPHARRIDGRSPARATTAATGWWRRPRCTGMARRCRC
ncbi:MAG: hypothetical protein MZW92_54585 [Comamonadaceae bacterium]|nr:hypothetical protein [Comamonadaceae bacterium]